MDEIKDISYIEGEFLAKKHGIYIKNPQIILKKLLKYIPREKDIIIFQNGFIIDILIIKYQDYV